MLWRLIQSDFLKMRKTYIWLLLFVSPVLAFAGGYLTEQVEGVPNEWIVPLVMMTPIHTILFLPLIIGVFTSFLCRFEHKNGGWKQLLSLPVKRTNVYLSKFILTMMLIAVNQGLVLVAWLAVGFLKGFEDPIPYDIMLRSFVGGWISTLPLAAIMLFISMAWSSFAAPLAFNVIFTVPNILVANSETFAPYYPWVQPFLTMIPRDGTGPWGGFFLSFESIAYAIIGGFILFFASGLVYINKKAV
ncbi:ABC transporter permease [Metabacillus malikii]|uniref:ABC transporter permease n=1 Tax=Metabacillus malikii TaxID=1504265 RepID=A0ABT9ZHM5_9BACI|nr:ABC transporter permease [Metabacillus malikii]MDQ0231394.1 hypothetical protein [Metabacillus malikii]